MLLHCIGFFLNALLRCLQQHHLVSVLLILSWEALLLYVKLNFCVCFQTSVNYVIVTNVSRTNVAL
jgi:hypothetical protein